MGAMRPTRTSGVHLAKGWRTTDRSPMSGRELALGGRGVTGATWKFGILMDPYDHFHGVAAAGDATRALVRLLVRVNSRPHRPSYQPANGACRRAVLLVRLDMNTAATAVIAAGKKYGPANGVSPTLASRRSAAETIMTFCRSNVSRRA